jgi:hypothetical protein
MDLFLLFALDCLYIGLQLLLLLYVRPQLHKLLRGQQFLEHLTYIVSKLLSSRLYRMDSISVRTLLREHPQELADSNCLSQSTVA